MNRINSVMKLKFASLIRYRHLAPALIPILLLALFTGCRGTAPQSARARDYTFFLTSDVHVGAKNGKSEQPTTATEMAAPTKARLDIMRGLVGQPYPTEAAFSNLNLGTIAAPRGLFILGDLTDGHKDLAMRQEQWKGFDSLLPALGVPFGQQLVPVFACAGNHDGALEGPARQGLVQRNHALAQAKKVTVLSTNGVHFAVNWDGVHFISLGLCPADSTDTEKPFKYGAAGPGSWNDPQGALSFLRQYLAEHVGKSGEPVIIMHHYGFDGFSMNDWNWWTPKQRRALYDALNGYNIAAILHGHNHHTEHYQWPAPKRHDSDLELFYDGKVPANPRQYDVISCGPACWVIRIRNNQLIAAHFNGPAWSNDPADFFVKSLKP